MPARGNPRTRELDIQESQQMVTADKARKNLAHIYQNQPKVMVKISPMYAPYFGKTMTVMLNGFSVYIPVDGSVHSVPQSFADEVEARVMAIDAILTKQRRMADVQNNAETSPGELKIF